MGGNREGFPVEQTGSIVTALNQGSLLRGLGFPLLILLMSSCASFRAAPAHPDLVWPLPPEPPRIRYAQIIREAKDIGFNPNFFRRVIDFLFGEPLTPQVIRPIGVATDSEGRLYVADNGLQVIHIFDLAKKEYRQVFWLSPSGPARLKNPVGVAVDRENHLYVSDADLNRIFVFDRKGTLRSTIGSDEDLMRVSSIAVDPKREILYAVDTPGHRLVLFDLSGHKIGEIGHRGTGPGEFNFPTFVALDRSGRIYVSDSLNFRFQVFEPTGEFIHAFGRLGDSVGTFSRPKGIAVDNENHVYVVDSLYDTVQIFDQEGNLLLHFGQAGSKEGEFWLPNGIAINQNEEIFIADSYNHRIEVFQYKGENATSGEVKTN